MKVYLDDERDTPDGWVRTYTAKETIDLLKTGQVTDLSLDHDLGDDKKYGTGYDVLIWLEENVATRIFKPPANIKIHSANVTARPKMEFAISCIKKFYLTKVAVLR